MIKISGLNVHPVLLAFVNDELLPAVAIDSNDFWAGFSALVYDLMPKNRALLDKRDTLQAQLDDWHLARRVSGFETDDYHQFLKDIGYWVAPGDDFRVTTENVDQEIAIQAGPQLVVPVMNARFALNACNARWGSLYDALYGTDVIPELDGATRGRDYNPVRGEKVVAYGRQFLDQHFPLAQGSFTGVMGFRVEDNQLLILREDGSTVLQNSDQWLGYTGAPEAPSTLLFFHNDLHVEVHIDRASPIGQSDQAGISDIVLESALTTIMDCEDSVAAVDAEDKVLVYRNWLGLMAGHLSETVTKNGKTFVREMAPDRQYFSPMHQAFSLPGRSLMFVRNVGHLMTTPAICTEDGSDIPEGLMDAVMTSTAALLDLRGQGKHANSHKGSVYIVKPKMHGPEEVAFTCEVFAAVEQLLSLPANTLKLGIMDEERRTSINLKACIRAASARVVFINTGFLDRTGDEIHTSMEAGPFVLKDDCKKMGWIQAYEKNNVAVGLACGLKGKAQIGKGMWAMPDNMADMMAAKIAQPKAGANTAWVPSPTAATLHAMHYHAVKVADVQAALTQSLDSAEDYAEAILTVPLLQDTALSPAVIEQELKNNAQGILGYVVRWVDQGVGCSKVPDIHNTALMEDRATLRISSQHICNWLHHGVCSEAQVLAVLEAMAGVVDAQNASDPHYQPMAPNCEESLAFQAAKALIFEGRFQPNGYTEPLLHQFRLKAKSKSA